jgi:hypothetical protein
MSTANNRLPVLDLTGEVLFFADDHAARELLRLGQVRLIRRRGRDRALQATTEIRRDEIRLLGRGSGLDHVRYSHRNDAPDNIRGVWAFIHLHPSLRADFMRVVIERAAAGRPAESG